jgi:hypothetical protein
MIDNEPISPSSRLVCDVDMLANALALQSFHPHRMAYLMKQVRAMETVCRKLAGETFLFANEVQYGFDIRRFLSEQIIPSELIHAEPGS